MGGIAMVVNPMPDAQDEVYRACERVEAFVEYLFGEVPEFPDYSVEEIQNAARAVMVYNEQKLFGGGSMLWPSHECVEAAYRFWRAGGDNADMPAVKIGKAQNRQLYFYL